MGPEEGAVAEREVEVVKGRRRRVRKAGMVAAMRSTAMVVMRVRGERGRLAMGCL